MSTVWRNKKKLKIEIDRGTHGPTIHD